MKKYLGVLTGKQSEEEYNKMEKAGMEPIASVDIPIDAKDNDEKTALFHCFIYYKKEAKELKLDL